MSAHHSKSCRHASGEQSQPDLAQCAACEEGFLSRVTADSTDAEIEALASELPFEPIRSVLYLRNRRAALRSFPRIPT